MRSLRPFPSLCHEGPQSTYPILWLSDFFGKKVCEGVLCVLGSFEVRFWGVTVRFWEWWGCPTTWPSELARTGCDWA